MNEKNPIPIFSSTLLSFFGENIRDLSDVSRVPPSNDEIFKVDDANDQLIKKFVDSIPWEANSQGSLHTIDLSRDYFGEELKDFFVFGYEMNLSKQELISGINRMGECFMVRSPEIQERANCFIIQMAASAEMHILGRHSDSELGELYEKAQLRLLLVPPKVSSVNGFSNQSSKEPYFTSMESSADPKTPTSILSGFSRLFSSSSRQNSAESKDGNHRRNSSSSQSRRNEKDEYYNGKSETKYTPPPSPRSNSTPSTSHSLFRTKTTLAEDVKNITLGNCFSLDKTTVQVIRKFIPSLFKDNCIQKSQFSLSEFEKFKELWTFFDFNNDGKITREDMLKGFSIIAENFIANDSLCQELANQYISRKIRHAISVYIEQVPSKTPTRPTTANSFVSSSSTPNPTTPGLSNGHNSFTPGMSAVFTDAENVPRNNARNTRARCDCASQDGRHRSSHCDAPRRAGLSSLYR